MFLKRLLIRLLSIIGGVKYPMMCVVQTSVSTGSVASNGNKTVTATVPVPEGFTYVGNLGHYTSNSWFTHNRTYRASDTTATAYVRNTASSSQTATIYFFCLCIRSEYL